MLLGASFVIPSIRIIQLSSRSIRRSIVSATSVGGSLSGPASFTLGSEYTGNTVQGGLLVCPRFWSILVVRLDVVAIGYSRLISCRCYGAPDFEAKLQVYCWPMAFHPDSGIIPLAVASSTSFAAFKIVGDIIYLLVHHHFRS